MSLQFHCFDFRNVIDIVTVREISHVRLSSGFGSSFGGGPDDTMEVVLRMGVGLASSWLVFGDGVARVSPPTAPSDSSSNAGVDAGT